LFTKRHAGETVSHAQQSAHFTTSRGLLHQQGPAAGSATQRSLAGALKLNAPQIYVLIIFDWNGEKLLKSINQKYHQNKISSVFLVHGVVEVAVVVMVVERTLTDSNKSTYINEINQQTTFHKVCIWHSEKGVSRADAVIISTTQP